MRNMFIRYVRYRATDADIPAKPRLLLLVASDDVTARPMRRRADKEPGRSKAPDKHEGRTAAGLLASAHDPSTQTVCRTTTARSDDA